MGTRPPKGSFRACHGVPQIRVEGLGEVDELQDAISTLLGPASVIMTAMENTQKHFQKFTPETDMNTCILYSNAAVQSYLSSEGGTLLQISL